MKVTVEYDEDKTRGNGVVLKQSISSGTTVDEGTAITITVNKLVETKNGTVTINVKALTGFEDTYKETNEDGEEVEKKNTPKDVTLKVTVDDKQVENSKVKENVTNKTVSVSGKGTITIEVWIDGSSKRTVEMDLNKITSMVIE